MQPGQTVQTGENECGYREWKDYKGRKASRSNAMAVGDIVVIGSTDSN